MMLMMLMLMMLTMKSKRLNRTGTKMKMKLLLKKAWKKKANKFLTRVASRLSRNIHWRPPT